MATIRLGKRTDGRSPRIQDFVPLATLDDLVFGGWDIYPDNSYDAAVKAGVLDRPLLDQLREPLSAIQPMPAVFDPDFVRRIDGPNRKPPASKMEHAEMLMDDIRAFNERTGVSRTVMIWCGSTEVSIVPLPCTALWPISKPACKRTIRKFRPARSTPMRR